MTISYNFDETVPNRPEGWGPEGWEAQNFRVFSSLSHHLRSFCVSLGVFSLNFDGVVGDGKNSAKFCWVPGDDFKIVSVFSAELGSIVDTCSALSLRSFWKGRRIQRCAWFNNGYKFMRHTMEGLRVTLHFALCSSSHMAGMNQKDSCPRSSSSSLSWSGG